MKSVCKCALCQEEAELSLSHIIPKFVYRYLKKDSFTGRLRNVSQPNIPLQDGDKMEMLCEDCERRFNTNETYFANKLYFPFKNAGFRGSEYEGNRLNHFITSVNWRSLYLDIDGFENEEEKQLTEKQFSLLKKAEKIMRFYLLNKRSDLGFIENHIFFFDTIKSADEEIASKGLTSFIQGSAFGYTVLTKSDGIYIYANLTGIIIVTIIKKHKQEKWKNTFVKNESGKIKIPQFSNSDLFSEIWPLLKRREEYLNKMSDKQRQQIVDKLNKNPEKFKESGTYKRFLKDREINS